MNLLSRMARAPQCRPRIEPPVLPLVLVGILTFAALRVCCYGTGVADYPAPGCVLRPVL
jgi:hypothetical protein